MTQLTRRERNSRNIVALPINAKVAVSWMLAINELHIRDRINEFDQCIEWPDVRQGTLESQVKAVIRDVPMQR